MPTDTAARPPSTLSRTASWSWPVRYPLVQFPNAVLAVALIASVACRIAHGGTRDALQAVALVSLSAWAYEELRYGVNAFRRVLGAGFLVLSIVRVAHALG